MKKTLVAVATLGAITVATPALAVDGCTVLLCLAGNWKQIGLCVPPVQQALRDMARGRPFPTCSDSSAANNLVMQWTTEPTCPPMYRRYSAETGNYAGCSYNGIVSVRIEGQPWSDVFIDIWSADTSTRYYDPARTALGTSLDPTFDNDLGLWMSLQPLPSWSPSNDGA